MCQSSFITRYCLKGTGRERVLVGISQHYVHSTGAVAAPRPNDKAGGCSTPQQVPISIKQAKQYPKQHGNLGWRKCF